MTPITPAEIRRFKLPEIHGLRGLGEPLFFSFTVDAKTKLMTSHGIIFCSLIRSADAMMKLAELDDDPRFPHLIKFLFVNGMLKGAHTLDAITVSIEEAKKKLEELTTQIQKLESHEQS